MFGTLRTFGSRCCTWLRNDVLTYLWEETEVRAALRRELFLLMLILLIGYNSYHQRQQITQMQSLLVHASANNRAAIELIDKLTDECELLGEDMRVTMHTVDRIDSRQRDTEIRVSGLQDRYDVLKAAASAPPPVKPTPVKPVQPVATPTVPTPVVEVAAKKPAAAVPSVVAVQQPSRHWYYLWIR